MALAGDDQQIAAAPSSATARRIAARAVADLERIRGGGQDLAADGRRILAARIVVGDDDAIGEPRGDLAHLRTLAAVAIAAAAEDDDQPAAGMGTQRGQHRLQRAGLVGIVDIDRRAIGMLGHALDAAMDAGEARHHGERPVRRLAAGDGEAEGGQEIVGLEGAGDRKERGSRGGRRPR